MTQPLSRIDRRFAGLKEEGRSGLVTFLTAGDPDPATALDIFKGLPSAGADLIEIGVPFSDPMADGPAIQASSLRAIKAGMTLEKTLDAVQIFRQLDDDTPVILMGYYNPIYMYGVERFLIDAKDAGVDGFIVVDLPPEEEGEFCLPTRAAGLNFIYLVAPTTSDDRLPLVLQNASGFVYFVSITGITGTRSAIATDVNSHIARIRRVTKLPIAVGFGIKTPDQAVAIARIADATVIGSALVNVIENNLNSDGSAKKRVCSEVLDLVSKLAKGVRGARS